MSIGAFCLLAVVAVVFVGLLTFGIYAGVHPNMFD